MKELYLNDTLAVLSDDKPIAYSLAVNDLGELADRQANITNRFVLPFCQINDEIMGHSKRSGTTQITPYRRLTAKYVQNGIEVIPIGYAIPGKVTKDGYEVQVVSGLFNFFDLIDGKKLQDIDFSDLEHIWNLENVIASQPNTEDYTYPLIDYGALDEEGVEVDVKQLRPALFEKTVLNRLITQQGFTYSGEIFDDPLVQTKLIPFTNDTFEHGVNYVNDSANYNLKVFNTVAQNLNNDLRDFNILFQDDFTGDPSNSWTADEYTAQIVIKVKASVNYTIQIRDQFKNGSPPSIAMRVQKYSGGVWTTIGENIHTATEDFVDILFADQSLEVETDLNVGEKLRVFAHSEPATDRITGNVFSGAKFEVNQVKQSVIFGQMVQLEMILPKLDQKAFLKDFMQEHGLICQVDPHRKHITFKTYTELYRNKNISKDWSEKFVKGQPSVQFDLGYGQSNAMKRKKDGAIPDGYGDGTILVDNENLPKTKDLFTSIYAASITVFKMSRQIVEIKKIEDPSKSLEFKIKTEPRILSDRKVSGSGLVYTDGTNQSLVAIVSQPYFDSQTPSLHFNDLIDAYYTELQYMLRKARKEVREILLNELDIAQTDFFIPVYDENEAVYYYLNGVNDFLGNGRTSKVELIKL